MVHARVSDKCLFLIHVHYLLYIPCSANQKLVNQYGEPKTPHKLATGTKYFSIKPTCIILYMCCTEGNCTCWHKGVKHVSSVISHKMVFWGIFVWILQHQKGYLICVRSTRKNISSHDVVFDDTFCSALAYTSRPYSEAISIWKSVSYIPCATSSQKQTDGIITFAQFE